MSRRIPTQVREKSGPAVVKIFATAGLTAVVCLSGCAGDVGPARPPRTPTMGATPPAPVPVISSDAALARASAAASLGDFAAMVRVLAALPSAERVVVVRAVATPLAQENLDKANRVAEALPGGPMQTAAIEIVAQAQVDRDPDAAIAWALTISAPSMQSGARQATAERLLTPAAQPAMARLLALPFSPAREEMLGYAAAAWARRDAKAALAWVRTLAPGDETHHLATTMGFAVAQSDPARAVELLDTLPEGRDRMVLLGAIGQTWVARDATEAWKWARRLPEGPAREAAFAGIETGLGSAGARFARSEPTPEVRVLGGGESAGHAGARPLGVERDDALRRKFDDALRESPVNAASYLASLPAPDRRDVMVDELVRRWLPLNPEAAKTWIEQNIPNPARREELLRATGAPSY